MNKTFVITGNRKGIGLELTKHYLDQGHFVIGCSRSESNFKHKNYAHFICDVCDEKAVKNVIKKAKSIKGTIDVLINNAGIASLNHSLLTPGSTVEKVFKTNYFGSFFFARETSKVMIKQKKGRIVNFSTVAVPLDLGGEMVYASSKAAIEKMTRIMAKELGQNGITINCIGPTPVLTDLIKTVPKNKIIELLDQQAIQRLGEFKDIQNVVDFFISDESNFITGQTIYLGGV